MQIMSDKRIQAQLQSQRVIARICSILMFVRPDIEDSKRHGITTWGDMNTEKWKNSIIQVSKESFKYLGFPKQYKNYLTLSIPRISDR